MIAIIKIEEEKEEAVIVKIIKVIKNQNLQMIELKILNHAIRKKNLNQEDKKLYRVFRQFINQDKKQSLTNLNTVKYHYKNLFN